MKAKYICPILTSMNEDGSVNYEEMHAFYDRVLQAGIDGILVGGSAGEFYAFTYDEIRTFILDAVKYIGNRGVVIAGTGRMAKSETISLSNEALQAGADAVIVVGPYYSACNEDDVYAYYDEILQAVKGPVYLYNYSERTGYDVSAETLLKLREAHDNLVGVKDTNPVLRHTQRYIQFLKPRFPDFQVYTGYDNNCIPSVISGGDGCIGAISNIRPDICADIIRSLASENISELTRLQRSIDKYFALYEVHTPFNPVMKWALKEMGLPVQEYCRVPIKPLTDKQKEALSSMANELWRKA
ncbi:dihydrodipicolinate synthase family protein [Veillonella magna]|uniref:dihydrodipicolinate synthase family protein n=1 Tax=Veillonella magna TaxID=464322 RepID=UPI00041CA682|nr:dihydrodipicolinate synthase family protein [Veillonella magna]